MKKPLLKRRSARRSVEEPVDTRDLGFGSRVSQEASTRLLNQDGSFNVARSGLPFFRSLNLYQTLLKVSWPVFYLVAVSAYLAANVFFAFCYSLCGPEALSGVVEASMTARMMDCFFFSVQTLGTIGYGHMSPLSPAANLLVTLESICGLLGLAVATGLVFARFARPHARILFSRHAVVAPYHGITAFEFRIANARTSQLIEVHATVVLSRKEEEDGQSKRKFYQLTLERDQVMFLPLHWVVVHPVTEASPFFGISEEEFRKSDPEILILLTAFDETFSQTVHSRSSYKANEISWGSKFGDIFDNTSNDKVRIDLRKLDEIVPADHP